MTFDELYASLPSDGWLTKGEARLLYWVALENATMPCLEVGCYKGRSTVLLASVCQAVVYSVDPFAGFSSEDPEGWEIMHAFFDNLEYRGIENVINLHLRVEEILWLPEIGLAYLDGQHTYQGTLTQIRTAVKYGATTIAVHDVNDTGEGREVKRAALEVLGPWDERVERLAVWNRKIL